MASIKAIANSPATANLPAKPLASTKSASHIEPQEQTNTIAIQTNQMQCNNQNKGKLSFVWVRSRHDDIKRSYPKLHMVTWNRRLLEF